MGHHGISYTIEYLFNGYAAIPSHGQMTVTWGTVPLSESPFFSGVPIQVSGDPSGRAWVPSEPRHL